MKSRQMPNLNHRKPVYLQYVAPARRVLALRLAALHLGEMSVHCASFTSVKQIRDHIGAFVETYNQVIRSLILLQRSMAIGGERNRLAEGVSLVRFPQFQCVSVPDWQTSDRIDPLECLAF
jgi:hypothetical protein